MSKRRLIAALIAFVLTIAVTGMWSAATIDAGRRMQTQLKIRSSAGIVRTEKGGNRVVKVLAAPFKAFGRLFGHNGDRKIRANDRKGCGEVCERWSNASR
jgi:hypothetical protein